MGGLTWLHLSDWHQKEKKEKDFDRQVVLDALIKDIKNLKAISQDLEKIDFIVFSGDVAFSGKPEEYNAAKEEFFDPLLKACNLSPENLFISLAIMTSNYTTFVILPATVLRHWNQHRGKRLVV